MKTIQKKSTCLVSDRAYRTILTNCVNVMSEKKAYRSFRVLKSL